MASPSVLSRPVPDAIPPKLAAAGLPALLERVYLSRGITDAQELELALGNLLPPALMPDVDIAAERLKQAVVEQQRILIVGDFDADGATSVALCLRVLKAFGAQNLSFIVPNRFEFGYGLSAPIVDLAAQQHPDLLVTVDNGISSVEGVARANELGIDVIITDHHLPGAELPAALAIVNPNRHDAAFGSRCLAGVGVAYYLLSVLRSHLRAHNWFDDRPQPNLADFLDLVALGTVADVVPLDQNNRVLVQQGLRRIRAGRACPGILALCQVGKRELERLTAADLGFAVGPRLNAAGRLDDMSIGIRCLLADSMQEAKRLALALDELNRARRELQQTMEAEAELIVAAQGNAPQAVDSASFGLCVYEPEWHQGVVGLVAGRLKDKLGRPVIAFAEAGAGAPDELKGSARSIPALHIRDVLDEMATRYPGLIPRFGGHAMAAGLSLKRIHLAQFSKAFDEAVRGHLSPEQLQQTVLTDGTLEAHEFTLELANAIRNGGPWGQGFVEPLFHGEFGVVSQRVVGQRHLKLTLKIGDKLVDAIAFGTAPVSSEAVHAVYRLDENAYGGRVTLQLVVEHLRPLA